MERGEENELAVYFPLFGADRPAEEVGYLGSKPDFRTGNLRAALAGSGIACKPIERELFDLYLDYFVSTGFLPAPPGGLRPPPELVESIAMTAPAVPAFPMSRRHPLDPPPQYRELSAEQRGLPGPDAARRGRVGGDPPRRRPRRAHRHPVQLRPEDARLPLLHLRRHPIPPGFFLNQDAPDHTRLRRLVTREFLISQMEAKRPRMQAILDTLLDDMARRGNTADLVTGLAFPMAATVMCELLDVPYEDHTVFVTLTDTILNRSSTPEQAEGAARELMAYFDRVVTAREQQPTDDMLGRLVNQEEAGKLSHDEFVGLAALLMLSGYDTMAQMIGLGTATLLEHPDQLDDLKADPSLYPRAIEELLRYLSINHAGLPRAATGTSPSEARTSVRATASW